MQVGENDGEGMRRWAVRRQQVWVLVGDWLDWLDRSKGRTMSTVLMYERILRDWVDEFGQCEFEAVDPAAVERWLQRRRFGARSHGATAQASTQRRDLSAVRGFYQYLVARGLIARNPMLLVCTPKVRNVNPRPVSQAVWTSLWETAGDSAFEMHRVALFLLFGCGLRREEVTRLRVGQVGDDLVIRNFVRKGGGEDSLDAGALTELWDDFVPELRLGEGAKLLADTCGRRAADDWLVGWADLGQPRASRRAGVAPGQLHPQHVNAWLDRLCRRAGTPRVTPHQFRHAFCTGLMYDVGMPLPLVSRLMNHTSVQTTMRYLRAGSGELREWMSHGPARNVSGRPPETV